MTLHTAESDILHQTTEEMVQIDDAIHYDVMEA